jgi:hypothetical protein
MRMQPPTKEDQRMSTRLGRHATTIGIAVVAAAITASITTVVPGMAASGSQAGAMGPLAAATPRVLAGVHTVRATPGAEPTIDKWFNAVNGVEPRLSGEEGTYDFHMGFRTASRFVLCTVDTNYEDTRDAICTASTPMRRVVRVRIWDTGGNEGTGTPPGYRNGEFWVLVYGP